jgi:hypothetical protein
MSADVLKYLADKLNDERRTYVDHLATGNIKGIEDYRSVAGTIRGLDIAITEIVDTMRKMEGGDDVD